MDWLNKSTDAPNWMLVLATACVVAGYVLHERERAVWQTQAQQFYLAGLEQGRQSALNDRPDAPSLPSSTDTRPAPWGYPYNTRY